MPTTGIFSPLSPGADLDEPVVFERFRARPAGTLVLEGDRLEHVIVDVTKDHKNRDVYHYMTFSFGKLKSMHVNEALAKSCERRWRHRGLRFIEPLKG